ncbi:hypothetical protein ACFVYD_28485 [Streptomyces sp. NPDC058301]|uniref:hypothetical protein n=1 Tax=Streptomyces sp. NPDC058301 TaxID=3346436 RepID=UPI0036EF44A6
MPFNTTSHHAFGRPVGGLVRPGGVHRAHIRDPTALHPRLRRLSPTQRRALHRVVKQSSSDQLFSSM